MLLGGYPQVASNDRAIHVYRNNAIMAQVVHYPREDGHSVF